MNRFRLLKDRTSDFEMVWLLRGAFRKAHARAGKLSSSPLALGQPNLEGFYAQELDAAG
jgi:hypothetical protein